jgi:hypothetical protein
MEMKQPSGYQCQCHLHTYHTLAARMKNRAAEALDDIGNKIIPVTTILKLPCGLEIIVPANRQSSSQVSKDSIRWFR